MATPSLELDLRPLSCAGGAEVCGVDLRDDLDAQTAGRLARALFETGYLLFRNQDLTPERQLQVGGIFGTISKQGENYQRSSGVRYVSNVVEDGLNRDGELSFHMDHSFYPHPLRAIMLYALETPPPGAGGETLLANAKLAYRALPDELKERIEGLQALHVYDYAFSRSRYSDRIREADIGPRSPRAIHLLALEHPVTAEKILYVSRRHVDRIFGLPEAESEALIEELLSYIYRPAFTFAHAWRPGDVLVFDNLALQHARTNFSPTHKRHLGRVQIA